MHALHVVNAYIAFGRSECLCKVGNAPNVDGGLHYGALKFEIMMTCTSFPSTNSNVNPQQRILSLLQLFVMKH